MSDRYTANGCDYKKPPLRHLDRYLQWFKNTALQRIDIRVNSQGKRENNRTFET